MKAIILAAGQGTRLRPLTDNHPKCMVEYRGKPIIDYILETFRACKVNDIVIVKGYLADTLHREGTRSCINARYESTNMVSSLFSAESELEGDVIISYADIIYSPSILQCLLDSPHEFAISVDKNWQSLWEARMEDPLSDLETMKINENGEITELGLKPNSYDDIQGQYMGLFKISEGALRKIRDHYHSLDKDALYRGDTFDGMQMTTFIQSIIDNVMPAHAVEISGGWLEIDCHEDLQVEVDFSEGRT